jgi:hypothetical protein
MSPCKTSLTHEREYRTSSMWRRACASILVAGELGPNAAKGIRVHYPTPLSGSQQRDGWNVSPSPHHEKPFLADFWRFTPDL